MITRQELLSSAKYIFARDGFENARLEDIASRAGKTRGAVYDHFADKEDVFFAIFEETIDRDMIEIASLLRGLPTVERRIEALAEFLSELSSDRERILLNLEFKLYAIRHPEKLKRLADLHTIMRKRCSIPVWRLLLPDGDDPKKSQIESLAIGAMVDGLGLNHLFDPIALNTHEAARFFRVSLREALEEV